MDAFARMKRPHCISPALSEQAMEGPANLGPKQRIIDPALRFINIKIGRHHIEIAGEHDRHTGREKVRGMSRQPVEPAQLVVESRAGRRISVGQIQATNQYPIYRCLDVAAVRVIRIARQATTRFHRRLVARKYSDTVPALLAMPDCAVTGFPDCGLGKFIVRGLQLLQTGDIRLGFGQPAHQHRKAAIDAVSR